MSQSPYSQNTTLLFILLIWDIFYLNIWQHLFYHQFCLTSGLETFVQILELHKIWVKLQWQDNWVKTMVQVSNLHCLSKMVQERKIVNQQMREEKRTEGWPRRFEPTKGSFCFNCYRGKYQFLNKGVRIQRKSCFLHMWLRSRTVKVPILTTVQCWKHKQWAHENQN